jgi:hypothetical protein
VVEGLTVGVRVEGVGEVGDVRSPGEVVVVTEPTGATGDVVEVVENAVVVVTGTAVVVVTGTVVEVVVVVGVVVVVVGGAVVVVTVKHVGTVIVSLSSVTAPALASTRPSMVTPVVTVALVWAKMVPVKSEYVPSVALEPTYQNTLQDCAPPARSTVLVLAVVRVEGA